MAAWSASACAGGREVEQRVARAARAPRADPRAGRRPPGRSHPVPSASTVIAITSSVMPSRAWTTRQDALVADPVVRRDREHAGQVGLLVPQLGRAGRLAQQVRHDVARPRPAVGRSTRRTALSAMWRARIRPLYRCPCTAPEYDGMPCFLRPGDGRADRAGEEDAGHGRRLPQRRHRRQLRLAERRHPELGQVLQRAGEAGRRDDLVGIDAHRLAVVGPLEHRPGTRRSTCVDRVDRGVEDRDARGPGSCPRTAARSAPGRRPATSSATEVLAGDGDATVIFDAHGGEARTRARSPSSACR